MTDSIANFFVNAGFLLIVWSPAIIGIVMIRNMEN